MTKRSSQLLIDQIMLGQMIISATRYALAHPNSHKIITEIQTLISRYAAVIPHVWIGALVEGLQKRRSRHTPTTHKLEEKWSLVILPYLLALQIRFARSKDPGADCNISRRDFHYLLHTMLLYSLGARSSIVGATCCSLRKFARHLTRHGRRDMIRAVGAHLRLKGRVDPFADSWLSLSRFLKSLNRHR